MNLINTSSSSATKYDDKRDKMDSKLAVGAARRSGISTTLVSYHSHTRDAPLNDHKIAIDVMIMTSLPSSHSASHRRSCCENGSVLTNSVMYHLVPHADELIMLRC